MGHLGGSFDDLCCRTHPIREFDHRCRRFRVHQHRGIRMDLFEVGYTPGLELLMDNAGTIPHQDIRTRLPANVVTEMPVGGPDDFSVFRRQVLGHLQCDARCHNPIGTGLNRGRGIGIDHHLALRVGIAEGCKLVRGTTKVQGAGCLEVGHQHPFTRGQYLCGLAHEFDPGNDQGLSGVIPPEPGHFQGIRDTAPGGLSQGLNLGRRVVMSDDYRVFPNQSFTDIGFQFRPALARHLGSN